MISSLKRILIATIVSSLGCAITFLWHIKNEPKSLGDSEAEIIAYISMTKQETHRKGASKALWEPAEEMDRLRSGDSVRTSSNSEARIKFYGSERYIDLESDSMIVIQKQESDINLDLLEGSLFVNGVDKDTKGSLTLNSLEGKVDLSKSATQLSGSSKDKLDLKVIKGNAQYLKNGGKIESIQEGKEGGIGRAGVVIQSEKVKILSPDITKPLYTNAISPTPTIIQWFGFAPHLQVSLNSGSNRKNLNPTTVEKLSPEKIQVLWKPGIYYWKLKATDPNKTNSTVESPVYKTEVIGRFPPTPVAPEPNFIIQTRRPTENITLRWNTPNDYKEVLIELINEKTKQSLFSKKLPPNQNTQDLPNLPLGSYTWKLTGFPNDNGTPLQSPAYKFFINEKVLIKIPIAWAPQLSSTQYFVSSDPKLNLQWESEYSDKVSKWKVFIAPDGTDLSKVTPFDAYQLKFDKTFEKPGKFNAFIRALDEEGEIIGTSEVKSFTLQELPLLASPNFLPNDNTEFLARPDGSINLRWNHIEDAFSYNIVIKDAEDRVVSQQSSTTQSLKISNLMPGTYTVQIGSVDKFSRPSEMGIKRTIQVPSKSEVKAPTLKKIKVN